MKLKKIANNVTMLDFGNRFIVFSYETPVIYHDCETLYVTDKFWSKTTSKHINQFLGGRNSVAIKQDELNTIWKSMGEFTNE